MRVEPIFIFCRWCREVALQNIEMDRVFFYAACFSLIAYVVVAQNPCRDGTNTCNKMRETCFVNTTAPNGYLCCKFSKNHDTYIYQKDVNAPIINCDPLKCIVCDSREHSKCGETFEYTDDEVASMKLLVKCSEAVNNTRACRKMVITTGEKAVVTRSCWGTPDANNQYYPKKCLELEGVESCYCTSHGCNSQAGLLANTFLLIATIVLAVWYRFF